MEGDTVAKRVSIEELPEGKSWHDLARPVVPYLLLAKELRESIGEQLAEGDGETPPEAWVNLDVPPNIREFLLDLIHAAAYRASDGDFEASRESFFDSFWDLDELQLLVDLADEDEDGDEDDDGGDEGGDYTLSVYAGDECVRTFPLTGFGNTWDFQVPIWFFHRFGADLQAAYQTALDINPSLREMLLGKAPSVALVFTFEDEVYVYEDGVLAESFDISLEDKSGVRRLLEPYYISSADHTFYELLDDYKGPILPRAFQDIPQEHLREDEYRLS